MTNRNELERLLAADKTARGFDAHVVSFEMADHLRNNAQHYLSLMDEVERLRGDRETLIEFAKSINSWRSDCDSYDRECSNPPRNYCEDVELMELSAGHALRRVNAHQALGETHDN